MGEYRALEKYQHTSAVTLRRRHTLSLGSDTTSDKIAEEAEFLRKGRTHDDSSHPYLVLGPDMDGRAILDSIVGYTNRFSKYKYILIIDFVWDHPFKKAMYLLPNDLSNHQLIKKGYINEVKREMECLECQEHFEDSCNVNFHSPSPTCLKPFLPSLTPDNERRHRNNIEETENINEQSTARLGITTMARVLWPSRLAGKVSVKWAFIVLNVIFETCQATFTQEAAQGTLSRQNYLKLTIITSSVCLFMSLVEAFHEGRSSGVVLRRRGYRCCFHSPHPRGQLLGTFLLYFGIICPMVQLIVNLAAKLTNRDFMKFDHVSLLLSICYLGAAIVISREKPRMFALVKCKNHGLARAEAMIDDGHENWVFECPQCQADIP